MSPVFGKKKRQGQTVAILDIESGSLGAALVRIEANQKPKLFGQTRTSLTTRSAPTASVLLREIEKEMRSSLLHLNTVAARMRQHAPLSAAGDIDRVAVFLHAPWVEIAIQPQKSSTQAHDETLDLFRSQVNDLFDTTPATFHAFTSTATPVIYGLFNEPESALVCTIGGEIAEVSLLGRGALQGHATVPVGFNTIVRTLMSHAGISRAEALSIISLARSSRESAWSEALTHAMRHFTGEVAAATDKLSTLTGGEAQRVFVLAPHPASDWFARMFTEDDNLSALFAPGSTVRPVLPRHASPHFAAHPALPDMPLMLESLFVDTRFGR